MLPVFRSFLKRHDRTVATRMLRYSNNYSSAGFQTNEKSCSRVTLATLQMYIQSPGAVSLTIRTSGGVCDFVSCINATHTVWASGLHTVIVCSQLTADLQRLYPQGVFKNKVLNENKWTFLFVYLHLRHCFAIHSQLKKSLDRDLRIMEAQSTIQSCPVSCIVIAAAIYLQRSGSHRPWKVTRQVFCS